MSLFIHIPLRSCKSSGSSGSAPPTPALVIMKINTLHRGKPRCASCQPASFLVSIHPFPVNPKNLTFSVLKITLTTNYVTFSNCSFCHHWSCTFNTWSLHGFTQSLQFDIFFKRKCFGVCSLFKRGQLAHTGVTKQLEKRLTHHGHDQISTGASYKDKGFEGRTSRRGWQRERSLDEVT